MTLSKEDGQLYYKLWMPLLDYVNKKYGVKKNLKKIAEAKSLNPADVKVVADRLWDDVSVIDEYLKIHEELPSEYRKIIADWKRCVRGKFIVERHLKKGSILISMDDKKVYQVGGIISSIEEMFFSVKLPLMIDAALIPFRDMIITDGLIMPYRVVIGGNMAKSFKDVYMAAKKGGYLIRTF